MSAETMNAGAVLSECGAYRYALWRDWQGDLFTEPKHRVCWVMLNPSTADEEVDDPTIRRCMGFARSWGHSGIVVVNLFAFRSTDPAGLIYADDAVGPDNDATIGEVLDSSLTGLVVCAWGANAPRDRADAVLALIKDHGRTPHALRLTKSGEPAHPLYLPAELVPAPFARAPRTETEDHDAD